MADHLGRNIAPQSALTMTNGALSVTLPAQSMTTFRTTVTASAETAYKLVNVATGLVLGVQDMSTADGGLAVVWGDTGTADHNWVRVADGTDVRFRNANSGKVLGVENMSTSDNARVLQWGDSGTADHRWTWWPTATAPTASATPTAPRCSPSSTGPAPGVPSRPVRRQRQHREQLAPGADQLTLHGTALGRCRSAAP